MATEGFVSNKKLSLIYNGVHKIEPSKNNNKVRNKLNLIFFLVDLPESES